MVFNVEDKSSGSNSVISNIRLNFQQIINNLKGVSQLDYHVAQGNQDYQQGKWSGAKEHYKQAFDLTGNNKEKANLQNKINIIDHDNVYLQNALNLPPSNASRAINPNEPPQPRVPVNDSKPLYVAQHETVLIDKKNNPKGYTSLRTENVGQCIAVTTNNKEFASLSHVDTQTSQESLHKMFYNLPKGSHEVNIFGGQGILGKEVNIDDMHPDTKFNAAKTLAAFESANAQREKEGKGVLSIKSADVGNKFHSTSAAMEINSGKLMYDPINHSTELGKAAGIRDSLPILMDNQHEPITHINPNLDKQPAFASSRMRQALRQFQKNIEKQGPNVYENLKANAIRNYGSGLHSEQQAESNAKMNQHFFNQEKYSQESAKTSIDESRQNSRMGSSKERRINKVIENAKIDLDSNDRNKANMNEIVQGSNYVKTKKEMLTKPKNWRNLASSTLANKPHISTNINKLKMNVDTKQHDSLSPKSTPVNSKNSVKTINR